MLPDQPVNLLGMAGGSSPYGAAPRQPHPNRARRAV